MLCRLGVATYAMLGKVGLSCCFHDWLEAYLLVVPTIRLKLTGSTCNYDMWWHN